MDLDVLIGIDPVEAVGNKLTWGVVQLGRELCAGRASSDDGDLELLRPQCLRLGVAADIRIHQAAVEARGIEWRVQRYRMLAHAWRAEIVALATHRDDQRVVTKAARGRD